ncbi:MAG: glucokinase [Nitrospiraceae bacterium]|nr:glucokinase [Nitrospiraceae bacterium]
MILAGDIGGTKTHLALFDWKDQRVNPECQRTFHSGDYQSLEDVLSEFLTAPAEPAVEAQSEEDGPTPESNPIEKEPLKIDAACFGVAGPVIENRVRTTNLPWFIDGQELAKRFEIRSVQLLNDLEATAHGLLVLTPSETAVLNAGTSPSNRRAIALIAAGTGLGEAILVWDGARYHPLSSEGGHTDFAPNSDLEIELLRHLRSSFLHVSYERVLSGPGLYAIYEFLRDTKKNEPTWLAERLRVGDPAPIIAEVGLAKQAEICVQALDLFASIYGAEAGNLALKAMAMDGVYLGGGIAPKLLPKLQDGTFMRAFTNKGRYKRLMASIPVRVIMNDRAGLLGAAVKAAQLARNAE